MASPDRIVVVGASIAGARTVQGLRDKGFDGKLILVGAEPHLPYNRPPLSKGLLGGTVAAADLMVLTTERFEGLDVDLRLGQRAESLDPSLKEIALEDGSTIAYDKLVIATGVAPRLPEEWRGLRGVHTLRTLDDSLALRRDLSSSARVVIVGGGFIGCEVAATARSMGCDVSIVEPLEAPMARALGPNISSELASIHLDAGVRLYCNQSVESIDGAQRVERVRLRGGETIDADVVVVGIGTRPETGWLVGSGMDLHDGIVCDQRGRTSVPDVFAAGDVARWFDPVSGSHTRVEHWTSASEQADFVAGALLDTPSSGAFASVPYVWSEQHGVKIEIVGRVQPDDNVRVVEGSIADRKYLAHFERDGIVSGALAVNASRSLLQVRRLLADRARSVILKEANQFAN
ncbi:3-phenylpropionate/trans-cinnamate dioxygenase ferredoxin reductase subunit [Arthrobacter sp. SLBN-100]|uniref:NAD(P)/FAD-dependent oxidoreductase n=1 Tax=Arthrobacter sp. SLBN-100 TaxID=2768450 RepID=UPI001172132B|nr:FAD-dependent oxidoreductase [Arthrobacter sp. SLBN-100]TQJ62158.1 3-phenylpropionate/trans-cinnamate dioxygenase ferredoxin reductase subunit [Arthrobacter sp. SLBN-100]